jgi:hypothetical protein
MSESTSLQEALWLNAGSAAMKLVVLCVTACACGSAFLVPVQRSSSSSALHAIKRDMNVAQHYGLDVKKAAGGFGSMFDDAAMLALIEQNAKKTEEQEQAEKEKKDAKDAEAPKAAKQ